jgi:malate dehydrogenase (oxaloacetate-decarboxylating)
MPGQSQHGESVAALTLGAADVDVIVCSEAGHGGGLRAAARTAAIYTAAAGIRPGRVIPVSLEAGPGDDTFLGRYIHTVSARFPGALLHFVGFSPDMARTIVDGYGGYRVFSNELQGTGTAVLAAVYAATRITGIPVKHQELVVCGTGPDAAAVAGQLRAAITADGATDEQAASQIWLAGPHGLLLDDTAGLRDYQRDHARRRSATPWGARPGPVPLAEIIDRVAPTILVATPAASATFTQPIIQAMCQATARPLILPISPATGPTPADIIAWSHGKALVATDNPAGPAEHDASTALAYPGLGLGVIVSGAARITPRMLRAAAAAIADQASTSAPGAPLLPGVQDLRACAEAVAEAVVRAAVTDQVASDNPTNLTQAIRGAMWPPAVLAAGGATWPPRSGQVPGRDDRVAMLRMVVLAQEDRTSIGDHFYLRLGHAASVTRNPGVRAHAGLAVLLYPGGALRLGEVVPEDSHRQSLQRLMSDIRSVQARISLRRARGGQAAPPLPTQTTRSPSPQPPLPVKSGCFVPFGSPTPSLDQGSGVDRQGHTGDVAGLVGGQPEHGIGDVNRLDPRDRQHVERLESVLQPLPGAVELRQVGREQGVGRGVLDHVGVDGGGVHRVDPDHVRGQLECERPHQAHNPVLRRVVVAGVRHRHQPGGGARQGCPRPPGPAGSRANGLARGPHR